MQQQLRTPQYGHGPSIQALLLEEASLPANCFQVNGTGKLNEGIEIHLAHPASQNRPALIVGEHAFRLKDRGACLYTVTSSETALVRRMKVKSFGEGPKPRRLLARHDDDTPLYVLVDPTMQYGQGVKPRFYFWTGVKCSGESLVNDLFNSERFIALENDADYVDVFYSDGRVFRTVRKGNMLTPVNLSLEEQAGLRIQNILDQIGELTKLPRETSGRTRRIDKKYHELLDIMEVGGKRSKIVLERIYDLFTDAGRKAELRMGVRNRLLTILKAYWPAHLIRFPLDSEPKVLGKVSPRATLSVPAQKPKGPPPAAKARRTKRSLRDAEERILRKGSSGGKSSNKNGGNKK